MTKYIIIEDEQIAVNRLQQMIQQMRPDYQCVRVLDSVESAVGSLPREEHDLVFMDVQLADGLSFEIFEVITSIKPIIFTTAYDQYAVKAFKTSGIDYLLKPIDTDELHAAIEKFENQVTAEITSESTPLEEVKSLLASFQPQKTFKERFVVKYGDHLKTVPVTDIYLFYSQDKATYLMTSEGRNYLIDFTLDKLLGLIDPARFYRISRKFIVALDGIDDIVAFSNSRLKLKLHHYQGEEVIVARERVVDFKQWLDG